MLNNQLMRRPYAADREKEVASHKVLRHALYFSRKGGGKHHSLTMACPTRNFKCIVGSIAGSEKKKLEERGWGEGRSEKHDDVLADGIPKCSTICRICGSNPMSSIRSASSRHKYLTLFSETLPLSIKSIKRPGAATRISQPRSSSRSCSPAAAPPYMTTGLIPVS